MPRAPHAPSPASASQKQNARPRPPFPPSAGSHPRPFFPAQQVDAMHAAHERRESGRMSWAGGEAGDDSDWEDEGDGDRAQHPVLFDSDDEL
jgi:hypothetical protein